MSPPGVPHPGDLSLAEARALVQRAVDKAEQLGLRGAIAVVGATGTLLTASRMDAGGPGGMARARSKAWISATQQIPSSEHLRRMTAIAPPVAAGFAVASPEALFPGAGGMPVRVEGRVVAGIAASGATVSPFFPDGVDPRVVSADGRPANPEDLLIAYALGIPYAGQHGDDQSRWEQRFGDLTVDPAESLGMAPAPPAARQAQLEWARALSDAAMNAAAGRGARVAVAVVDSGGDPIQQDLMDGAPAGAVAVAQAVAGAAALFGCGSGDLGPRFGQIAPVAALVVPPVLGVPGGLPVSEAGRVVAGLGVGGGEPAVCEDIARTALAGS
ncbi:MAG TPA: heme-binding protein [Streptosporangiaceae bacterium]|nr:heme-binding protein [Streptosporangiaceae bacterium]